MIDIEKDVPLPESKKKKWGFLKDLKVGDSFFYPLESTRSYVYMHAKSMSKYYGIKITGRTVNGGLRIWRVE